MEQSFKNQLVSYFTFKLNKDEETANKLIELYGPFIEKIKWEKGDIPYFFYEDIIKTYEQGITPEEWVEKAKSMENTMQNPVPELDFYRLKELLTDFDVDFKVEKKTPTDSFAIVLKTNRKKIVGYGGFQSEYLFDKDGNFIEIGIWE